MIRAPFNLTGTDGAIVIWYEDSSVSAVQIQELDECLDSIKCRQFECCFHQHYKAYYEGVLYPGHLWEFLLNKQGFVAKQDQIVAALALYKEKVVAVSNTVPKCIGCGLADWLLSEQCPLCSTDYPKWNGSNCLGCLIRGRKRVCNHIDSILIPKTPSKVAPKNVAASAASVTLYHGSPAGETAQSLARAAEITPAHNRVKRPLHYSDHSVSPEVSNSLFIAEDADADGSPHGAKRYLEASSSPNKRYMLVEEGTVQAIISTLRELKDGQQTITKKLNRLSHGQLFPSDTSGSSDTLGATNSAQPATNSLREYGIKDAKLDNLVQYASSRKSLAARLVREVYPDDGALEGKNCSGKSPGKEAREPLDQTVLQSVRKVVFSRIPVETGESRHDAWKACCVAIDSMIRGLKHKKKQKSHQKGHDGGADDEDGEFEATEDV